MANNFGDADYGEDLQRGYNWLSDMPLESWVRVGHTSHTDIITRASASWLKYDHCVFVNGDTEVEQPSVFGGFGCGGDLNQDTEYAGIAICSWPRTYMPDDIGTFMVWCRDQWLAGNKTIDYTW